MKFPLVIRFRTQPPRRIEAAVLAESVDTYSVICAGSLSIWYANPPFRVNHFAKRTMELEWEDESSKGGPKPVPVHVTHMPKGKYLIEVFLLSPLLEPIFVLLLDSFRYCTFYFRNPHLNY